MGEAPSMEDAKAAVAGVFDRAAGTYDQVGVDFFRPVGRFLVDRTAPRPGERVLDVGCGRGASAIPAAEAVGAQGEVVAIDLAAGMVEAVRRASDRLPWLQAQIGDAEHPPPGPFDVVQAGLVLFFLPSLQDALARYRSVLARPGRLGFTWFGDTDARWQAVFEALIADLPDPEPERPDEDGPFGSVAAMHRYLTERGWSDPATETKVFTAHLSDAEHWFRWSWSHGLRSVLEDVQRRNLLPAARERVTSLIDRMLLDHGELAWRTEVHATIAHA